jgi:3-deoxy-manno-octulosonate cytidylyltransferase (CMP-KDO synthetase)
MSSQNSRLKSHIVIPARLASSRLPSKLLLSETGKPLIQHTYEAAQRARLTGRVCVAADSEEIATVVRGFGGQVFLTNPDCASGTDRIAEVAPKLGDVDVIVNVQGDEPLIEPSTIDAAIEPLIKDEQIQISTTSEPILSVEDLFNPSVVKVVTDARGFALYFSRSPIPSIRTVKTSPGAMAPTPAGVPPRRGPA